MPLGTGASIQALRAGADAWLDAADSMRSLEVCLGELVGVASSKGALGVADLLPQRSQAATASGNSTSVAHGVQDNEPMDADGKEQGERNAITEGLCWVMMRACPVGAVQGVPQAATLLVRCIDDIRSSLVFQAAIWRAGLRQWRAARGLSLDERVDLVNHASGDDAAVVVRSAPELSNALEAEDDERLTIVVRALEHAIKLLQPGPRINSRKKDKRGSMAVSSERLAPSGISHSGESAIATTPLTRIDGKPHDSEPTPLSSTAFSRTTAQSRTTERVHQAASACMTMAGTAATSLELAAKAGLTATETHVEHRAVRSLANMARQPLQASEVLYSMETGSLESLAR